MSGEAGMGREKRGKQTLRKKMMVVMLISAMSSILAVVIVSYMTIRMIRNDSIQESMQIYLEQITRETDSAYYDMISIVNQMSPSGLIGNVVESYLSAEDNFDKYKGQKSLREELVKLGYVNTKLLGVTYYDLEEQSELIRNINVRNLDQVYQPIPNVHENIGNTIDTEMTISDGNAVYRYDAFANTLTEVSQKSQLILQPYESVVFLQGEENQVKVIAEELEATFTEGFDRGSGKKSFGTDDRMEDRTDLLPKKWKVTFADSCSYPEFIETVPTEKLDLISSITGFENKSGTVRYEGTMQLEKIDTERSIQLELGNTYETAEVFVNGHSEGVRICKPYRFHLTGLLREGENQLAVEVTNTLGTQMRDAISHYLPIEPFGVEGMVHLYMGK